MNSTTVLLVALVAILGLGGLYLSQRPPVVDMIDHSPMEEAAPVTDSATNEGTTETSMSVDENAKVFEVGGTNFTFDVTEIRVEEGDTVTINFRSDDGFHDWVVDEFDAATDQVRPGTLTSVTFVADRAGTYEYYCSVGNHRAQGMVGKLIVE